MSAVADPATFAAAGGAGTLSVTANRDCVWSASPSGAWIAIGAQSSGQGTAQVAFTVSANPDPSQRRGSIAIGDHEVAIAQDAACVFTVSPVNDSVSADGERRTITVTANGAQCAWSARSESEWLTILEGSQGTGNGQVVYEARRSTGSARNGELTVAGHRVAVSQSGCSVGRVTLSPESHAVASTGGPGAVVVTTTAACAWTATSNASWISITPGGSRIGNGTVQFTVAATTGPARTGTLAIAGRAFAINQSSGCTYSLNPAAQTVSSGGGSVSVAVSTSAGCPWTAMSSVPWVRATTPTGTGAGAAAFTVDPTPSSLPRSARLTIAGQAFTLSQDGAACLFNLSPPTAHLTAAGGAGSFEVNGPEGCTWTAGSNDGWLRVTAGPSGSGDGTVTFSADPNPGPARVGTIVAGGRVFTAFQAAAGAIDP